MPIHIAIEDKIETTMKVAIPPTMGIASVCNFRLLSGTSTRPTRLAILASTGTQISELMIEQENASRTTIMEVVQM